jgi:amino acid adenylation domain-containing protein
VQPFALSTETTAQLRELSRREGATLFMTLLAAFQTLLYRYSGQKQITVGTDIANRNYAETEPLIGFFVNQLVLLTDLSGDPTFVELLRRVKEVCLGAYTHQDVPFEKLVEELQPERNLGRSPLFQVKMLLQNAPSESLRLQNLEVQSIATDPTAAKLDLTLIFSDLGPNLMVSLQYISDLFNDTTIQRMQTHLSAVLESIVADPQKRLSQISIPAPASFFLNCNKAGEDFVTTETLQELFETQVEQNPEALALVSRVESLTYGELNARANQLAHYLRKQGVGPEVVVGLCMERSVEMVVALLGTLKAGGAYLPLDPDYPRQRLEYLLADAQAGLVLTQARLLPQLPVHSGWTIALDDEWNAIAAESEENPLPNSAAENLAYVIYTSGSTGQPKGVMITQGGLVNYLQWASTTYPFAAGAGSPLHSTLAFDLTVTTLYAPLLVGGWVELTIEGEGSAGLEEAWRERSGYAVVKLTPAHLRLLNSTEASAARLRQWTAGLIVGGEPLNWEQVRPWAQTGVRVYNEYGPTETVVGSSAYEVEEGKESGSVPIGQPISNTEMYVLDEWQQPVAIGVRGEIYIGGAGVARGYWQRAELTAERFVPHPYSVTGGERLYRTGDEGRYLEDGRIEYLGRRDQQVKVRGYRIELGEIEAVLESHSSVRQAVVTVREESAGDQRLVAYLLLHDNLELNTDDLKVHALKRLPGYMIPQAWVIMDEFPLTRNGKLDRHALPAPERDARRLAEFTEPQTAVQKTVADIWAEVLELDRIDIHDDFFELGGHSLLGTQVTSRVREVFNIDIHLRSLFEYPTVAGYATALENYFVAESVTTTD